MSSTLLHLYASVFATVSKASQFYFALLRGSRTYNFVEVSGNNLESFQTRDSAYNVYITNQLKANFAQGKRGVVSKGDCE